MEEFLLFGISFSDDTSYVLDALSAHEIPFHELSGEGNLVSGYPIYLQQGNISRATEIVSATHRFRTGDLKFYILKHPNRTGEPISQIDHNGIVALNQTPPN
jgi:hypothetical protein